jgi:hypothetical protein
LYSLELSPFCKIDAHLRWAIGHGPPEMHFAGTRSVEPLFVTLGEIRESRLEMLSFVLQMESNKRPDKK